MAGSGLGRHSNASKETMLYNLRKSRAELQFVGDFLKFFYYYEIMSVVFREESCMLLELCHVSLAEAQVFKAHAGFTSSALDVCL